MTDIVDRLRILASVDNCQASIEAADEIERLRAALKEIEQEALSYAHHGYAKKASAALTVPPAAPVSPWMPIDTAPKDGTLIVALTPAPQFVRWWTDLDGYGEDYPWVGRDGCSYKVSQVTHWMPLPAAPKGGE